MEHQPEHRKSIGPYILENHLGSGAHGQVFRAHRRDSPQVPVALKIVPNRGSLDHLMIEPELLSRLDHPGIIGLKDYFMDGDDLVISLEFVDGPDLESFVANQRLFSAAEVRELLKQVAQALEHAHANGILHRDLKLSNILVESGKHGRRYVLGDFGISRISEGIQTVARKGGTYGYMAPEQLRGRPDKQSDLWALGVVAYRLLSGSYPFQGANREETTRAILYGDPSPIRERVPNFDDANLENIVMDLLEKSLDQRIASSQSLLTALQTSPDLNTVPAVGSPFLKSETSSRRTWERTMMRRTRMCWIAFWLSAVLALFPLGPYLGLTVSATVVFLYLANADLKRWQRRLFTGLSLTAGVAALLAPPGELPAYIARFFPTADKGGALDTFVRVWGLALPIYYLVIGPLTVFYFIKARQLMRELRRRQLLGQDLADPQKYLSHLRSLVIANPGDSQLQFKYAEAFLAQGNVVDAAVEASLVLDHDPLHLGANLLLANVFLEMRLTDKCQAVCSRYLMSSPQCFEFVELAEQCRLLEGAKP